MLPTWCKVLLITLVLMSVIDSTDARKTRHRKHKRHQSSYPFEFPPPPLPFAFPPPILPTDAAAMANNMPPVAGAAVPPMIPSMFDPAMSSSLVAPSAETNVAPSDAKNSIADLMRFARVGAGVSTGAEAQATTTATTHSADNGFRNSILNLLSESRDRTVMATSKLDQLQQDVDKQTRAINARYRALKQRQDMLNRLEFCLETSHQNANTTRAPVPCVANATLLAQIQSLEQREARLLVRERELSEREHRLKTAMEAFLRQQDQWNRAMNDVRNATNLAPRLNAAARNTAPSSPAAPRVVTNTVYLPPSTCAALRDCTACTATPKCGWCGATKQCLPTVNGTTSLCDSGSWSFNFCKENSCAQHVACRSCMADPRCGRCEDSNTCMSGSANGPSTGTCSRWSYASSLRIFSYNVYGRDLRNCSGRAWWLFKMIQQTDADFVLLQEVEDWFLEALAQERWAVSYFSSDFGSGHAPGGLLILSKYPLEKVSYYEKTEPGQVEVDQRARALVVRPKIGSRTLSLVTTALDWRSSSARADSLKFITSVVQDQQDVVLAGDFNFDDDNADLELSALPIEYSDVWKRLHPDQTGYTWDPERNAYAKESDPRSLPSRIDRVYARSDFWNPSTIEKVGCPEASPHYGLLSDITFFDAFC